MSSLFCGNCLDVMKGLPDSYVDLVVTSPPYDDQRKYEGFSFDFPGIAKQLFRIVKDGGVVVWIVSDETKNGSETGTSFRQALFFKEIGFNLHDTMIWKKTGFTDTGSLKVRYGNVFEYMFVLSKGKPKTFNPIKDRKNKHAGEFLHGTIRQKDGSTKKMSNIGKVYGEYGQRFNVWEIDVCRKKNEKTAHPAQFPEELVRDHVLSWSNEGDIVLDPFMGSGTSCVVCKKTGRQFVGIEISKKYFEIAERRLSFLI